MDAAQYAIGMRTLMRAATWPKGNGELVLGKRVYVAMDGLEAEDIPGPPFAMIHVGDYSADAKLPTLHTRDFHVVVVVPLLGDRLGEQAIVGGPRSGDVLGSTRGRGVLEVSQALLRSVRDLTGADGLPIDAHLGTGSRARPVGENRSLVAAQHLIRAVVTADPEYPEPPWFTATKNGADVDMAWKNPVDAGLFRQVVIQYIDGSTPPADETVGTRIYAGTDTSVSHTPTGFPASYSIFGAYTVTLAEENQAYSENEPATQRTVTS